MSKRTAKQSTYRTIGAASGHFLTAAERAENAKIAEQSRGTQLERAEDAATLATSKRVNLGRCPCCEYFVFSGPAGRDGKAVSTLADCPRCEMYRAAPEYWRIGEDGTWWAV